MAVDSIAQYKRACRLIVVGVDDQGLDLSEFRIKFAVKRSNTMTPNTADIRVYNLKAETAKAIQKEFTRVILQAGYEGNFGVIFQGNIKQVLIGRESATDTFIEIVAGDGDLAYNFAVVNATLAAGSTLTQQLSLISQPMEQKGVSLGHYEFKNAQQLPRGKVFWGNSTNYLRDLALTSNQDWSIQDEKIQFVPLTSYLPDEVVVLTAQTGLIGSPQQTNDGVNLKCLLNPLLKIGGRVQLNNASIQGLKINLDIANEKQIIQNIPAPLTDDGVYFILVVEHQGDTRGQAWYSNLVTLIVDPTSNPANSVVP